jgi:HEAT repeat protein
MRLRRGTLAVRVCIALLAALAVAAVFSFRDAALELWHIHRLSGEYEEWERADAAERLVALRSRRAVPRLVEIIREEDDFGDWAPEALARFGARGIDALARELETGEPEAQVQALTALERLGPEARAAAARVARCFGSAEAGVRAKALAALLAIDPGHAAVESAARALLADSDGHAAAAAAILLERGADPLPDLMRLLRDTKTRSEVLSLLDDGIDLEHPSLEGSLPALVAVLGEMLPNVPSQDQGRILSTLETLGPAAAAAWTAALPLLETGGANVKNDAARFLAALDFDLARLREMLRSPEPAHRAAALEAVESAYWNDDAIESAEYSELVTPFLEDADEDVRVKAVDGIDLLLRADDAKLRARLLESLQLARAGGSEALRRRVAVAVTQRYRWSPGAAALERMVAEALADPALGVRVETALELTGGDASAMPQDLTSRALMEIQNGMRTGDASLRRRIVWALARLDARSEWEKKVLDGLWRDLLDFFPKGYESLSRLDLLKLLAKVPRQDLALAGSGLKRLLQNAIKSWDEWSLEALIDLIASLGPEGRDLEPFLRSLVATPNAPGRAQAIRALIAIDCGCVAELLGRWDRSDAALRDVEDVAVGAASYCRDRPGVIQELIAWALELRDKRLLESISSAIVRSDSARLLPLDHATLDRLQVAFHDRDPHVRAFAASVLCCFDLPPSRAGALRGALRARLGDPDSEVAEEALWTLAKLGALGSASHEELLRFVEASWSGVRSAAFEALSRSREQRPKFIEALRRAIENRDVLVRLDAARALVRWGDAASVHLTVFQRALKDKDEEVRDAAAECILDLGPSAAALALDLAGALRGGYSSSNDSMLRALAAIGPAARAAMPRLLSFLETKEYLEGDTLLSAILAIEPANGELHRTLLRRLASHRQELRDDALKVLAQVAAHARSSAAEIAALARDAKRPSVRASALEALALFPESHAETLPVILERIAGDHEPSRAAAAAALAAIGGRDPRVEPALLRSLRDASAAVRAAALRGLGKLPDGPRRFEARLLAAIEDRGWELREAAAVALAEGKELTAEAQRALLFALGDDDYDVRSACARGLAKARGDAPHVVPALLEALRDESESVRAGAAASLGAFPQAAGAIAPRLLAAIEDNAVEVRAAAVAALARLGASEDSVVLALVQRLGDEASVADAAAAALQSLGPRAAAAAPALEGAVEDQDTQLRERARSVREAVLGKANAK